MSKDVVIIGASGHGKVIADIVFKSGDKVVGFLDDGIEKGTKIAGIEILGAISEYVNFIEYEFIVAIGNSKIRERISKAINVKWYTAIHPSAIISSIGVKIGEGTVIAANATIGPSTIIGKHCIINTGAIIDHDNIFGDYSHASANSMLSGTVSVGKNTLISVSATVIKNKSVCDDCLIGAGAVVIKDITESGTYVGVPARKIK